MKADLLPDPATPDEPVVQCAVKRLQYQAPTDEQELEFQKEINIMAQLDHPNIVRIVGMCLPHGSTFIFSSSPHDLIK